MAKRDTLKKTIDITEDLFEKIMQYAHYKKIYKFSPAVVELLNQRLDQIIADTEEE